MSSLYIYKSKLETQEHDGGSVNWYRWQEVILPGRPKWEDEERWVRGEEVEVYHDSLLLDLREHAGHSLYRTDPCWLFRYPATRDFRIDSQQVHSSGNWLFSVQGLDPVHATESYLQRKKQELKGILHIQNHREGVHQVPGDLVRDIFLRYCYTRLEGSANLPETGFLGRHRSLYFLLADFYPQCPKVQENEGPKEEGRGDGGTLETDLIITDSNCCCIYL